jgi:hypothetical protein
MPSPSGPISRRQGLARSMSASTTTITTASVKARTGKGTMPVAPALNRNFMAAKRWN